MAGGTENGGARTPFAAGDITASPRKREKSEPASLHSTMKAVMAGPSHPTHEQPPVKTIASASLMQVRGAAGAMRWGCELQMG